MINSNQSIEWTVCLEIYILSMTGLGLVCRSVILAGQEDKAGGSKFVVSLDNLVRTCLKIRSIKLEHLPSKCERCWVRFPLSKAVPILTYPAQNITYCAGV